MPCCLEDSQSEKQAHLLLWLAPKQSKIRTLQELWRSPVIVQTLIIIDKDHFSPLQTETHLSIPTAFQSIQIYINQYLGKRLERKLKASVLNPLSLVRLCELILYISVYCANKKEFIQGILCLPTPTQTYLMNVIDELDESIYVMDLTEILQKVESLEAENERLESQVREKSEECQAAIDSHRVTLMDLETSQRELEALKREKINLFKEFQIDCIEDYADMYRKLYKQYTETQQLLSKTQQRESKLYSDLANSKFKIIQDNKLISHLYEQIDSLKALSRHLRGLQLLQNQPLSPESSNILKQNNRVCNSMEAQSPLKQLKNTLSKQFSEPNQELEQEVLKLRNQIEQLTNKMETYYEITQSQKEVIDAYREDIVKLRKCNEVRKWKLQELQCIHSDLSKLVFNRTQ